MWHNGNHLWTQIKRFGVWISMQILFLASLLLHFLHIIQFMLILILFDFLASFTTLCFSLSDLLSQRILIVFNIIKLLHSLYFWYILIIVFIYYFQVYLLETYRQYLLKFICYFTVFCELSRRVGGRGLWRNTAHTFIMSCVLHLPYPLYSSIFSIFNNNFVYL